MEHELYRNKGLLIILFLEELSEDDLLSQYSLSFTKKTKKNGCEGTESLNSSKIFIPGPVDGITIKKSLSTPPTTRNKFAAFLQRKNEESGAVVVPGTRSRYVILIECCLSVVLYTLWTCILIDLTFNLVGAGVGPGLIQLQVLSCIALVQT